MEKNCEHCKHVLTLWNEEPCAGCGIESASSHWEQREAYRLRGFEVVAAEYRTLTDDQVYLPLRGSKHAAGYDFYAPMDLVVKPGEKIEFATDIKAYMGTDEVLLVNIRSSTGSKLDMAIANTQGIIDSDYYSNAETGGNIVIKLRNMKPQIALNGQHTTVMDSDGILWPVPVIEDLTEKNTVVIKKGERVAQGIFVKYKESDNCNTDKERVGGFGSTDRGKCTHSVKPCEDCVELLDDTGATITCINDLPVEEKKCTNCKYFQLSVDDVPCYSCMRHYMDGEEPYTKWESYEQEDKTNE